MNGEDGSKIQIDANKLISYVFWKLWYKSNATQHVTYDISFWTFSKSITNFKFEEEIGGFLEREINLIIGDIINGRRDRTKDKNIST